MPNFNQEDIFKKPRRVTVKWIAINLSMFAIAVAGTCYKFTPAANLTMFLTVALAIMTIMLASLSTTPPLRFGALDQNIPPAFVEGIFDIVMLALFATHGWFWSATFYIIHMIAIYIYRTNVDKPINAKIRGNAMLEYYGTKASVPKEDRLSYLLADLKTITPDSKFREALKKAEEFVIGDE